MDKVIHPQQMATVKWIVFVTLLIVASVILLYEFKYHQSVSLAQIAVSAAVGILFASLPEVIPEAFRRIDDHSRRGRFLSFFGQLAGEKDVRLIFAHRVIKPSIQGPAFDTYYRPPCSHPVPEGVRAWLSFHDVRAGATLAGEIAKLTGRTVKFMHDKDVPDSLDDMDYSAVSLGLGFNGFTNRLEKLTEERLFRVVWEPSARPECVGNTDHFKLPGVNLPKPSGDEDYAIVTRYVPMQPFERDRFFFSCAGRTAQGTAAAGRFLAFKWESILNLYKQEKKDLCRDSLTIVIKHLYNKDQDEDSKGEIAELEGKRLIFWYSPETDIIKKTATAAS